MVINVKDSSQISLTPAIIMSRDELISLIDEKCPTTTVANLFEVFFACWNAIAG